MNDPDLELGMGEGESLPFTENKMPSPESWEWHECSVLFYFLLVESYNIILHDTMRREGLHFPEVWSWCESTLGRVITTGFERLERQASKSLGRKMCMADPEQRGGPSAQVDWGLSLTLEGERNSEQQSRSHLLGQSLRNEEPVWTHRAHLDAKEESRKGHLLREGERHSQPLGTLGEVFSQHTSLNIAISQTPVSPSNCWDGGEQREAKTTEQLTFGDGCETLIKTGASSTIWEGELQKNVWGGWGSESLGKDQCVIMQNIKYVQMSVIGQEQPRGALMDFPVSSPFLVTGHWLLCSEASNPRGTRS